MLSVFLSSMLFTIAALGGSGLGGGGVGKTLQFLQATPFNQVILFSANNQSGSPEAEIDPAADINPIPNSEFKELSDSLLKGESEINVIDEQTQLVLRTFIITEGEGELKGTLVLVEKKLLARALITPPSKAVK